MNRVSLTPVYVLHRRPYRNTSLLVELFSKEHGRVSAVARSARGPQSRYRGNLQAFIPMQASWSGQGELKTLNALELEPASYTLAGKTLIYALYLNELLLRLLQRHDPYPRLYQLYEDTLKLLSCAEAFERSLRIFEKNLLHELGYGLLLHCEAKTGIAIQGQYHYRYHQELGFMRSSVAESQDYLFSGKSLLDLDREALDSDQSLKDAKRLMRMALNVHLGDKPIASRELLL